MIRFLKKVFLSAGCFFLLFSFGSSLNAETKTFKSELGFSFTYKITPSAGVEKAGFDEDEETGAMVFNFTTSFNLAAQVFVYDSKLPGNKNQQKVASALKKDLKAYALEKFNSFGTPECKANKDLPQCEYEAKSFNFKKISFSGQTAYTFEVEAQPMGFNLTIADFKNKRYIIKNKEALKNFKFE